MKKGKRLGKQAIGSKGSEGFVRKFFYFIKGEGVRDGFQLRI